jgi:non-specific serine/threonine protein kinase/serine/threonine-protein kinase
MLTPESWAEITELFGLAMDLPAEQRSAFVARVAGESPAIARELACLLDEHEHAEGDNFLPSPGIAAPLITDLSGTRAGPYRLVRLLGDGGMGAVYLAERSDGAFSKQVALKLLSPAFFHAQERFQQEREFLARLDHPNLTRLLDGGTTSNGLPYLVVEYVDGVSITRYCTEHDIDLDGRLQLLLQVCAGIAHAHQRLIIHSDIKPEDILVTADGTVKILDFGIATLRDSSRTASLHRPATPAFSSPEQLSGEPMTTASDVYSIGVVAHVVLTGRLPYAVQSNRLDQILEAVLKGPSFSASQTPGVDSRLARRLKGDLDAILARAIAKDPERRYASAQQLAEDIERYRYGFPVRARARTMEYRLRRFIGRYRVASALAVLTLVCLVAGIAVSRWQANVAQRRFDDLRSFAHAVVFDVDDALSTIPGTTAAREQLVKTALQYLDRLGEQNVSDPVVREELAAAYLRIGQVQGGAFRANLGDSGGAVASFRKAIAVVGASTATARLDRAAIEAHIEIAKLAADPVQSLSDFDAAIAAAEKRLAADPKDIETLRLTADAYQGRATVDHETDRVLDELRTSDLEIDFRSRVLALAPDDWRSELNLADAMAQRALALEQRTDYAASLAELRSAEAMLEVLLKKHPGNQLVARGLAERRSRSGPVLLAMGKARESAAVLESAIGILEPIVRADPGNAQYRGDLAFAWFRLAEALRAQGQTARALELHQQVLALRRARVARDPHFTFIRWDLSRSLNAVAQVLLIVTPGDVNSATALFEEARELTEQTLRTAPSFNELRKQLARAEEGLGQAAQIRGDADQARVLLQRGLKTWQEVLSRGPEDRRDAGAPLRVQALLSQVSANEARVRRP